MVRLKNFLAVYFIGFIAAILILSALIFWPFLAVMIDEIWGDLGDQDFLRKLKISW